MKRFIIKWGNWDSNAIEVPGKNIEDAMEAFRSKYPNVTVNSITCLGSWL